MNRDATIVLCGGPINVSNLPIGTNASNAMVPVNGKPVVAWILEDLIAKGIKQVTVVVREQDHRLQGFLQRTFTRRMEVRLARLQHEGTILQSLQAGLRQSPTDGLVRIVLGDTLVRDPYEGDQSFVYVGDVEESRRWCLAVLGSGDRVIDYVDKQDSVSGPWLALSGYYHMTRGDLLASCVDQSVANGEREFSDVLRRYGASEPIHARRVKEWFDFGSIDNLVEARRRLLQARFFNTLVVNPVLNTISKVSVDDAKLRDELNWYLTLPTDLQVLAPRIVRHTERDGRIEIVQEYYGYPTLAELYVYGELHPDVWRTILRRVLATHAEFLRYPGRIDEVDLRHVYWTKTWDRLEQLCSSEPGWQALLDRPAVSWNDRMLHGLTTLRPAIERQVERLVARHRVAIVHGDFCFSNILFDMGSQVIRLIDPRGSFGPKTIFGDPRYDVAKLRHSITGLYDYIMADMFEVRETDSGFEGAVYANGTPRVVAGLFDRMIAGMGYDVDEIRFIEGLLFLSMLPLHRGHPDRQRMMFVTGLERMNEVLRADRG